MKTVYLSCFCEAFQKPLVSNGGGGPGLLPSQIISSRINDKMVESDWIGQTSHCSMCYIMEASGLHWEHWEQHVLAHMLMQKETRHGHMGGFGFSLNCSSSSLWADATSSSLKFCNTWFPSLTTRYIFNQNLPWGTKGLKECVYSWSMACVLNKDAFVKL